MQNPQEQRQEVLIKRIVNSVDRLSTALSDLSNQMNSIQQYNTNMEYLLNIWQGCEEKMRINNEIR